MHKTILYNFIKLFSTKETNFENLKYTFGEKEKKRYTVWIGFKKNTQISPNEKWSCPLF